MLNYETDVTDFTVFYCKITYLATIGSKLVTSQNHACTYMTLTNFK